MAGATLRHLAAAAVKGSRHDLSAGMLSRKNNSVAAATQMKGSRAGVYRAGKLQLTPILRGRGDVARTGVRQGKATSGCRTVGWPRVLTGSSTALPRHMTPAPQSAPITKVHLPLLTCRGL